MERDNIELDNLIEEIRKIKSLPLKVPAKLLNPDKLIISASRSIEERMKMYNYENSAINTGFDELNINVSKNNIKKALRFMDALIKLLRVRGHDVLISNSETVAMVYDQKIEFRLNEKQKRINSNDRWSTSTLVPTGLLTFRYKISYKIEVIMDGREKIENQLPRILAIFELRAKREKLRSLEIKKYWENYRIEEEKQKELENRKLLDVQNFKKLYRTAERMHQANIIREYLKVYEANAASKGLLNEELSSWVEWAKRKADWFDPLIEINDELLNDIDPDRIDLKEE